jgi:preprotein translocase subunit YajC
MFISNAYAQSGGVGGSGDFLTALIPWIFIIVIFYFLLIRPQQKRVKQHKEMVESVAKGDKVVTQGGLLGKVTKVAENEVTVEIAKDVKVQVVKSTLSDVVKKGA